MASRHHREALRPQSRVGARTLRRHLTDLRRARRLPYRPLPGQGNGPEHHGDALRQRHVRAAMEGQLRRFRADHDGRRHRHRNARGLLRRHRCGPRHHSEPPAPAHGTDRHGGARSLHARGDPGRKGKGIVRRTSARGPGRRHGPRTVRGRLAGRRPGARLPRGGRYSRRLNDRHLRGNQAVCRHATLGGRSLLPARRQAPG